MSSRTDVLEGFVRAWATGDELANPTELEGRSLAALVILLRDALDGYRSAVQSAVDNPSPLAARRLERATAAADHADSLAEEAMWVSLGFGLWDDVLEAAAAVGAA